MMEMTEREKSESCVRRFQEGDRRAFDDLVRMHQRKAYGFVVGMISDCQEAEDILQEGFLKAYEGLADFRRESSFKTWFYRILINLTRDRLRGRVRRRRLFSWSIDEADPEGRVHACPDAAASPVRELEQKETGERLREVVDRLSVRQKEVLTLRYFQDMNIDEISFVLGCRPSTVKVHLFRAVREAGRQLARDENQQEKTP